MKDDIILVTGGSGFIGGEVVFQLKKKGYTVFILDIKPPPFPFDADKYIHHDLRHPFPQKRVKEKIKAVIHLAAEVGGVTFANQNPATILKNNLFIDSNALDLAKDHSVKRFTYISSSLIYEHSKSLPYKEEEADSLPLPNLTYGVGKYVGERLTQAYWDQYKLPYTICRLFNVYGMNQYGYTDSHGHVIPDFIKKVKRGDEKITIMGSGNQTRSFTHVTDIARGIIMSTESIKAKNEPFNIGVNSETSVRELLSTLWRVYHHNNNLQIINGKSEKEDVTRSRGDVSKAKKLLNWSADITLEEGVKDLINVISL